jgi:hypothetical protein
LAEFERGAGGDWAEGAGIGDTYVGERTFFFVVGASESFNLSEIKNRNDTSPMAYDAREMHLNCMRASRLEENGISSLRILYNPEVL